MTSFDIWINKSSVNPKSTSNQSSKPCTVLQYPSRKIYTKYIGLSQIRRWLFLTYEYIYEHVWIFKKSIGLSRTRSWMGPIVHRSRICSFGTLTLWNSMLQCVAVCCGVFQCAVMCCSVLQCVAVRCIDLELVLLVRVQISLRIHMNAHINRHVYVYINVCIYIWMLCAYK